MTGKQCSTAANRINERLRTARKKYPGTDYTNELERRIITLAKVHGLVIITPNGPQLTRSKSKWAAVPPGLAEGILNNILDLGTVQMLEYRTDQVLEGMNIPVNDANRRSLLEGVFNADVSDSSIWDIAYKMRSKNQQLYDMFERMRGKSMRDWDMTFDEYTEELRRQLLYGEMDDLQRPDYGPNYRKDALNYHGKEIAKLVSQGYQNVDPDALAQEFAMFGQAEFGKMENGQWFPADYSALTDDQRRFILRKFLK